MPRIRFALLVLLVCLQMGCDAYTSEVPLSTTRLKIDKDLIGVWSDPDDTTFTLRERNETTYRITIEHLDKDTGTWETVEAAGFLTDLEGTPIFNFEFDTDDEDGYLFFKYEVETTTQMLVFEKVESARIWLIEDTLFEYQTSDGKKDDIEFKTSRDFYKYARLKLNQEGFFAEEPMVFTRLED